MYLRDRRARGLPLSIAPSLGSPRDKGGVGGGVSGGGRGWVGMGGGGRGWE